jgi:hypothetical protein
MNDAATGCTDAPRVGRGRPPASGQRGVSRTKVAGIRLTEEERTLLDRLHQLRGTTDTQIFREKMVAEFREAGLLPETDDAVAA